MINKNIIRLTESDLRRIIKESVNRILRESVEKTYRTKSGKERQLYTFRPQREEMNKYT